MSDQVEITPELAAAAARAFFKLHRILLEMEKEARQARHVPDTSPAFLGFVRAVNLVHIQMHQLLPPEALEDVEA